MRKPVAILLTLLLLALLPSGAVHAKEDGIYNRSNGCSCHGSSSGFSAQLTGLPSAYTPGTSYTLSVSMAGSPATGGFNLEVSKGTLSNPDANTQVASNGLQATHDFSPGTTSWSLDWTAPPAGSGATQFDLAVVSANNNGFSSGDSYATTSMSVSEAVSTNNPPEVNDVVLTPAQPTTLDALTVTYTYADDDGNGESGTVFTWHRNGVVQTAHTAATLPASATNRGETWFVSVTPSDGVDAGTAVNSATVTVLNSAPAVTDLEVSDEAPDTTDDVSFTFASNDPDGDTVLLSESRWRLDGTPQASLHNTSTLPALATRPGDVWDVQVRVSDGEDVSAWFTSAPVMIGSTNQAPAVTNITVSPSQNPTTDDAIAVSWTESDPEGDAIVETELVWTRNGDSQPELDDLNPLPAEYTAKGDIWQASVRISDGLAWSQPQTGPSITVTNAPPVVVEAKVESASFSALHDLHLNLTTQDADGDERLVETVTWYMDGEAQSAGSGALLMEASRLQRGQSWYAVVTVTDGTDASTEFTTPSVLILNAPPSVALTWPTASSSLVDLLPTLTVSDVDEDEVLLALSWFKNGFRDASLENATGVPADKLAPGQVWSVVIQATDGQSSSEVQEHTHVVANLAPTAAVDVRSTQVWSGETTVLSAEGSTDADGTFLSYRWLWGGQSATGVVVALVLDAPETVTLTVTDASGATDTATIDLEPVNGPFISQLEAIPRSNGEVDLAWSWNGDATSFNVLRNGVIVAQTDSTRFTDLPLMSGPTVYSVQPFNEERVFIAGSDSIDAEVVLTGVEEPSPSDVGGFVLGGVLLLALALMPMVTLRKGGEEA